MRLLLLTVSVSLAFISLLPAQAQNTHTIEAGDDVQQVLGNQLYRYPSFQTGKVFFRNGKSSSAKLNLNLLLDEMQFIDPKKDTLAIADPASIQRIELEGTNFFFSNGYAELLEVYGEKLGLAVKRKLKIADRQQEGAYGQKTSTSSISSLNTHLAGSEIQYNLKVKEYLLMAEDVAFYLVDEAHRLQLLNKATVIKAFPAHKAAIVAYIRQHKTDFKKEEDVRALLAYSSSL